jgi:tight adherence protein C
MLLAAGAAGGAIGLAILAATLLARIAEERDLSDRLQTVLRPADREATARARSGFGAMLLLPVSRIGEMLRDSALISEKEVGEIKHAVAAVGLDPRHAVPVVFGAKAMLLVILPLGAFAYVMAADLEFMQGALAIGGALVLAVFAPNWVLGLLRRPFQTNLRKGLPDALDLLVVAAEAGLGLESAVDRVAREMAGSNRPIALELNTLVQELRMLPDRHLALERLGDRTNMDSFRRLGATLSQTFRYGTPLAEALRVLAAEMREERMLRIEEKAVRLPALLIGPLILFILPALFIALLGPSIMEIGKTLGGTR